MVDLNKALESMKARTPAEELDTRPTLSSADLFEAFLLSAGEGVLEPFGYEPSLETQQYRRDYPVQGVGSELAGFAIPYTGWFKLTKAPKAVRMLSKIGDIERRPIRTAIQRELARWAPFEAGRIGIAGATGGDVDDIVGEAAIDLGLFGGLAGIGAGVASAGQRAVRESLGVSGINLRAPPQIQIRQLAREVEKRRDALSESQVATARAHIKELEDYIRQERITTKGPYVGPLEVGESGDEIAKLFVPGGKGIVKRQFIHDKQLGFKSREEWEEALERAVPGKRQEFFALAQYPRRLGFNTEKAARAGQAIIRKNFQSLGNGWYWAKEANEGLYIMARKYKGTEKAAQDDLWVLFKTDQPGIFVPERAAFANRVVREARFLADQPKKSGGRVYDMLTELAEQVPLVSYVDDALRNGKPSEFATRFSKATGLEKLADNELRERAGQFIRKYLAPTQFQFGYNPRARWIWGLARAAFDRANAEADAFLHGATGLKGAKSLYGEVVAGGAQRGGLIQKIDELDEGELFGIWKTWNEGLTPIQAREIGLSPRAVQFLEELEKLDADQVAQIVATQRAAGLTELNPLPQHYALSRSWRGDWRTPVFNDAGSLVFMGSGHTRPQALKEAEDVITEASGRNWRLAPGKDKAFEAGRVQDLDVARLIATGTSDAKLAAALRERRLHQAFTPRQFRERHGVRGYIGEKAPWSKADLKNILTAGVIGRQKYIADVSVRNKLQPELTQLGREDRQAFEMLSQRLDDLSGRQGPFARITNQATDTILAPVVGPNSATKIVRAANTVMFDWTLGMGNLGFVAVNALTFLQTTLPQIAYTLHAPPGRLARYYTWLPAAGADGLPKAGVGMVEPLKVLRQSFREMGKPDDFLRRNFERAAAEGVWDPRFVEEFVGETSRNVVRLKESFRDPNSFWKGIMAVSRAGPAVSEKFVRGHAFVTGHIIGRDFLRLDGDALYRFAKEFTENTQFLYGTADRARVITSPLGSLFGLFKNWQMHYMGWMLEYAGEASRGNWGPLLWMTGGTGAAAGAGGLPLYGIADAASRWLSDDTAMKNIYDSFGPAGEDFASVSDGIYMGLPAFLGVSLQGSAAAPFADPARDASMLFSFVHYDRMAALGKAVGQAVDNWSVTGSHPIDSRQVRDQFVRALAPKTFYRTYATWSDKYLRSLSTGYPQIKDLTPAEKLLFSAGINPRYLELTYKVNQELWEDQQRKKARVQEYGKAWAEAQTQKDYREMRDLMSKAAAEGVDISSLIQSAQTRLAKGREDMIDRQFNPREVFKYRNVLTR